MDEHSRRNSMIQYPIVTKTSSLGTNRQINDRKLVSSGRFKSDFPRGNTLKVGLFRLINDPFYINFFGLTGSLYA